MRSAIKKILSIILSSLMVIGLFVEINKSLTATAATSFKPGWPLRDSYYISALDAYYNGGTHNGIDVWPDGHSGQFVYSIADGGVVERANYHNSFGYSVQIKYVVGGETYHAIFAHMREGSLLVKQNDTVNSDTKLGKMGSTGESFGEHLHLAIYKGNTYDNNINKRTFDYYLNNTEVLSKISIHTGLATYSPLYGSWIKNNCVLKNGRYYYNNTSYTLSYNVNGGIGTPATQKGNGSVTITTYIPARTGYTFNKWNTKADGSGASYAAGASFNLKANTTLYAQWTQNKLTVNYYSNNADKSFSNPLHAVGSGKNVLVKTYNYSVNNYGGKGGLHNYSKTSDGTYLGRTGYTATGNWNTKADGTGYSVSQYTAFNSIEELASALGKDISTQSVSVNLYPEWTENKLNVNYYSNYANKSFSNPKNAVDSANNVIVKTGSYSYESKYELFDYSYTTANTYLGRTGYTATGYWNTKADGSGYRISESESNITGNQIAKKLGADISTGNKTINLYPEWKSGVDAPVPQIDKTRAAVNETILLSWNNVQNANIAAYRIVCYDSNEELVFTINLNSSTSNSFYFSLTTPGDYSITAKAITSEGTVSEQNQWQFFTVYNTYDVTFNPNYSNSWILTSPVESDIGVELKGHIGTRDNYVFVNWNTKPDGTGKAYYADDLFYPEADTVLYAIWQEEECEHSDTFVKSENYVEPTCSIDGSYDVVTCCLYCQTELGRETLAISALGHSFTVYVYNDDATTEKDGTETAKCDCCNETDTRTKPGTKLIPENLVNPTSMAKLKAPSSTEVEYAATVTVKAKATDVPRGYYVALYDEKTQLAKGSNTEVNYTFPGEFTSTKNITVKIIDDDENVQKDGNGKDLTANFEVKAKSGFFAKLIAFFKRLFKALPSVTVEPK